MSDKLTAKDFATSAEVRWCPGCDDYVILRAMQKALPEMGVRKENVVFISGIGCSSCIIETLYFFIPIGRPQKSRVFTVGGHAIETAPIAS